MMKRTVQICLVAIGFISLNGIKASAVATVIQQINAGSGISVANPNGPITTISCTVANVGGPALWNASTSYPAGSIVIDTHGNYWRAIIANKAVDPVSNSANHNFNAWEYYDVVTDATIIVPAQADTINIAIAGIDNARIGANPIVKIQVADGRYSSPTTICFHHPEGDRVFIIGDQANPARCEIDFSGPNGIFVTDHGLGMVDGMTLVGPGIKSSTSGFDTIAQGIGIFAEDASVKCGPNVFVENWDAGFLADRGSIRCDGTTVLGSLVGYAARNAGFISANRSHVFGPRTEDGYWAFDNASISAVSSSVTSSIFGYSVGDGLVNATSGSTSGSAAPYGQTPNVIGITDGGFIRQ